MFVVRRSEAGRSVVEFLRLRLRLTPAEAGQLLRNRGVWVNGRPVVERQWRMAAGQRVRVRLPERQQPTPKSDRKPRLKQSSWSHPVIRYSDAHIVVVEKPAGLTTMRHPEEAAEFGARAGRFLPATLADMLPGLLAQTQARGPTSLRAVHRLDKDTSGLVVFARTAEAERDLGRQFRAHSVERSYLAVVHGRPSDGHIESWLVRDRGDGRRGSSSVPGIGQHAVTHVHVVEPLGEYSFVECRLETGRTHQLRIHLGEAGAPICGERVYNRPVHGKPISDDAGCTRVALHAATLGFNHPATKKHMVWKSALPDDLSQMLKRLRQRKRP
jgi:23S rRNA pseudouridine1911/1915/1917 synthase